MMDDLDTDLLVLKFAAKAAGAQVNQKQLLLAIDRCVKRVKNGGPWEALFGLHFANHCRSLDAEKKAAALETFKAVCLSDLLPYNSVVKNTLSRVNYRMDGLLHIANEMQVAFHGDNLDEMLTNGLFKPFCPLLHFGLRFFGFVRRCIQLPMTIEDLNKLLDKEPYKGNTGTIDQGPGTKFVGWIELAEIYRSWEVQDPNLGRTLQDLGEEWKPLFGGMNPIWVRLVSRREGLILIRTVN